MLKLAQRPDEQRAPDAGTRSSRVHRRQHHIYYAFLSYSHKDADLAEWLHGELEDFHVPHALAGKLTRNGVIPARLTPIFRDEHELAAADDLGDEIKEALAASKFLVVLCSPDSAKSRWTDAEIETFKRVHPEGCVLAAILAGEPFASELPGREHEECFPPSLRHKFDRRGRPTGRRAEPLAADLRGDEDGRRLGLMKLVAGMLGVGLDDLVQRETTRRHRRMAWITAASLAGMLVTSGLAVTAIDARDSARDQRREAESLIAFMVGDLKDKLEPVGRLDALAGVGSRVLAYYRNQDTSSLSDSSLSQRSKALGIVAEVAFLRGDAPAAFRLYREAMNGTAEAIRRDPNDPERLFEHAQNVFYFGESAMLRGDLATAEGAMRDYKGLAARMIQLEPDNIRWRLEAQYADFNLGIVLYRQRRFSEAEAPLVQALQRIQGLAAADPANAEYQSNLPEALAWAADVKMAQGKLTEGVALREQQVALLNRLLSKGGDNINFRTRLVRADQLLGEAYAMLGRRDTALAMLLNAVTEGDRAVAIDPNNTRPQEFTFNARFALAKDLLTAGDRASAQPQIEAACTTVSHLLARDSRAPKWRAGLRDCWLLRTQLALSSGAKEEALQDATRAVQAGKSVQTDDVGEDRVWLAQSYRLVGDVQRSLGNAAAAQQAWQNALASYPKAVAERPIEMSEHAVILQRLGRAAEAQQLTGRLAQIGYRLPELKAA